MKKQNSKKWIYGTILYWEERNMAWNSPVIFNNSLPLQQNILLPVRLPNSSPSQTDIFKPFPIVDIKKNIDLSSVFRKKQSYSYKLSDQICEALDFINKEAGMSNEKIEEAKASMSSFIFEFDKNRIRAIILKKTNNNSQYANDSMDWLNEDNIEIAEAMLNNKNFSRPENIRNLISILNHINRVNNADTKNKAFRLNLVPKLIDKFGKTTNIDISTFMKIYENITPENEKQYFSDIEKKHEEFEKSKERIKTILLNKNKSIEEINELIYSNYLNENNFDIAEIICQNKDFNIKNFRFILSHVDEINKDFIKTLYTDDKCKMFRNLEVISNIIYYLNEKNIEFAKWICLDDEAKAFRTGDSQKCCNNISTLIENYPYSPVFTNWICKSKESQCFRNPETIEYSSAIARAYGFSKGGFGDWICKGKETQYLRTPDNIKYIPGIIWALQMKDEIIPFAKALLTDKEYEEFRTPDNIKYIRDILSSTDKAKLDKAKEFCKNKNIPKRFMSQFIGYGLDYSDYEKLIQKIGKEKVISLPKRDFPLAVDLQEIYQAQNINELPRYVKNDLLNKLIAYNTLMFHISDELKKDFPLIPTNKEEYCEFLPQLVNNLGIETKGLNEKEISSYNYNMHILSNYLVKLSDSEFADLEISQEFSRNDFILTILEKTKNLQKSEKKKVFDYFGFELKENDRTESGYTISGYPINSNNPKKYSQIENAETKQVIECLRNDVIRFSENNKIKSNNSRIENLLNEIAKALPEIHTLIGNKQHDIHNFDVMKHSLKVMQKIVQTDEYQKLSDSDKKIMLLASLLHDITKFEAHSDSLHAIESSFDAYFITKKFNLTREEEIKLFTLISNHEWLKYVNTAKNEEEQIQRMKSTAFELQQNNLFDMALIFTHADLKAIKVNDNFHNAIEGQIRYTVGNAQRSLGEAADIFGKKIKEYIHELKKSQPLLPVTKIPTADIVKSKVTKVNPDGSTNIKGLYIDKEGLPIIKFNEVENWEELGFPKGTISRGIKAQVKNGETNTGNIKFFVHGLDEEHQLINFDGFSLLGSKILLSVSYAERPESKFRFFRTQGVIGDVDTDYVYGGGESDGGSGNKKSINEFKQNYILGGEYESERLFISNLIKKATGMNDEEYITFVEKNKNKSMLEIEPIELREKLIRAFAKINSDVRIGEREYDECYVSKLKPMATFAYPPVGKIGNPVEYFEKHKELSFLTRFSKTRNLPRIAFGE